MAAMTLQQAFDRAVQFHQAGRLAEAEAGYRQILGQHPNHPESLHLLGAIAYDVGHSRIAIDLIQRAIVLKPSYPEAYSNLGNVLREMGQLDEAIAACRQAIVLKPSFSDAHSNLGNALTVIGNDCRIQDVIRFGVRCTRRGVMGMQSLSRARNCSQIGQQSYLEDRACAEVDAEHKRHRLRPPSEGAAQAAGA